MPTAGPPTVAQLFHFLRSNEEDPERRERLFQPFWGPRSAFISQLTIRVLAFVVQEWDRLHGAQVLDYGCGVIPYERAVNQAGATVIGADIGDNRRATVKIGEDGCLPVSDATMDYVLSIQVLEHVTSPLVYLGEAFRVLKPGGRMFLTTHGLWPDHPAPRDLRRWTRSGLLEDVGAAGFHVMHTRHVLNEYSAAVQFFVIAFEYRHGWGIIRRPVHLLARLLIEFLEWAGRHYPEQPAAICLVAEKP